MNGASLAQGILYAAFTLSHSVFECLLSDPRVLQIFKIKGSLVSIIDPFVNPNEQPTPVTDIQSDLYSPITTCNGFEI